MPRDRVFVCSALRGNYHLNQLRAEAYCKQACDAGKAPFAPHLLMTRFLNDDIEDERISGIESGIAFLMVCKELWAFTVDGVVSPGMRAEVETAYDAGITIKWFAYNTSTLEPATELRHLQDNPSPTPAELMFPTAFATQADDLFRKMESAIKAGDFAEDYEESLDIILGTGLTARNREAEEIFETVIKNQERQ